MLNSKLYNPDNVWAFLQDLWEASKPGSKINWSFSGLCKKHSLHQVYGTVINQETNWLSDEGEWQNIAPRKNWVQPLIAKVKNYSSRAQQRHENLIRLQEVSKKLDIHLEKMSTIEALRLMIKENVIIIR